MGPVGPATPPAGFRVMLVDDNPRFRTALRALLERDATIRVVADADSANTIIDLVGTHAPDVVVMDLSMPGMNGLEATIVLKRHFPDIDVVVLSSSDDREGVNSVLDSGASAFLVKGAPAAEIISALKQRPRAHPPSARQAAASLA